MEVELVLLPRLNKLPILMLKQLKKKKRRNYLYIL